MRPLSYERAAGIDDALAAILQPGAAFYAGGTTLVDLMKLDVERPSIIVDINRLPCDAIDVASESVMLGALARMSDTADDDRVRLELPAVTMALEASASGQLRNMASLGGNVLQRTRCAYFRDTAAACNKREPGSGCGARNGINDEHAILGTSDLCIAVAGSDFAVPLVAFGATIHVRSQAGVRAIPVTEFYVEPVEHPERDTTIAPGELIVAIEIPRSSAARNSTYVKIRDRTSYAYALASCAAGVERFPDGTLRHVRLALGGVGTVPWRAREAEAFLIGKPADPQVFAAAARAEFANARPTKSNAYKIDLGIAAIVRALETVTT